MGWNSWNSWNKFACDINEQRVREVADAMGATSDEAAAQTLLQGLDREALYTPRPIHLILDKVGRLAHFFHDCEVKPELIAEFNRLAQFQFEAIRDLNILHYKLTKRTDSAFWRYCAAMPIPDMLAQQIELFRSSGRVSVRDANGLQEPSCVSIGLGPGLVPECHAPFVGPLDEPVWRTHFAKLRHAIAQLAAAMPQHGEFIAKHRQAPAPATRAVL